jgi:hypothetical protein
MASILSFGTRMFRTRNPARDADADRERFLSVRNAIASAIDGAARERAGLQRRLDAHYAHATSLLDNSPEFGSRSPSEEQSIAEAERNAVAAAKRIAQISEQIEQLSQMLSHVEAALSGNAA